MAHNCAMVCRRISEYVEYVEGEQVAAEEEAHPACVSNRLMLEKAWQVVANEFFDPRGTFSQAAWAHQLLDTLKARGTPVRCSCVGHGLVGNDGEVGRCGVMVSCRTAVYVMQCSCWLCRALEGACTAGRTPTARSSSWWRPWGTDTPNF